MTFEMEKPKRDFAPSGRDGRMPAALEYRSLFWPIALIGFGAIWLLGNLNILTRANLAVLGRLWPLILIVIGLDLLIGRRSTGRSAIIGIGAVAVVIALMFVGPSFGLAAGADLRNEVFTSPLEGAQSANITLAGAEGGITVVMTDGIHPLSQSESLLAADLSYYGQIDYQWNDEPAREITLRQTGDGVGLGFLDWFLNDDQQNTGWRVGIADGLPIALSIFDASGSADIDLSGLHLTALTMDEISGGVEVSLPAGDYSAAFNDLSGHFSLNIPAESQINVNAEELSGGTDITLGAGTSGDLHINDASGGLNIDVPDGAALRVEVSDASGGLSLLNGLNRVSGGEDGGVWQTENYVSASTRINLVINESSGGLDVR